MSVLCIQSASVPMQPWRNGGGRTRPLFSWPEGDQWRVRVSLAEIESDGQFSVFSDTQRWFSVVTGAGVCLTFAETGQRVELDRTSVPITFDGGQAPWCTLRDGPTQDLNLMVRQGHGIMRPMTDQCFDAHGYAQWGAYVICCGVCDVAGQPFSVAANTLIWSSIPAAQIVFRPDDPTPHPYGWWLGVEHSS